MKNMALLLLISFLLVTRSSSVHSQHTRVMEKLPSDSAMVLSISKPKHLLKKTLRNENSSILSEAIATALSTNPHDGTANHLAKDKNEIDLIKILDCDSLTLCLSNSKKRIGDWCLIFENSVLGAESAKVFAKRLLNHLHSLQKNKKLSLNFYQHILNDRFFEWDTGLNVKKNGKWLIVGTSKKYVDSIAQSLNGSKNPKLATSRRYKTSRNYVLEHPAIELFVVPDRATEFLFAFDFRRKKLLAKKRNW